MRFILLAVFLILSTDTFAGVGIYQSSTTRPSAGVTGCVFKYAHCWSESKGSADVFGNSQYVVRFATTESEAALAASNGFSVTGIAYTDGQCQAAYGGNHIVDGVNVDAGTGAYSANSGACKLTAVTSSEKNVDMCGTDPDTGSRWCSATWEAVSTGDVNDAEANHLDGQDYLESTDDPSQCSGSYVSSGGQGYCYTGGADNLGSVNFGDGGVPLDDNNDNGNTGGDLGGGTGSDGGSGGSTGSGSSGGGGVGGGGASGGGSGSGGSTGDDSSDGDSDSGDGLGAVLDAIGSVRSAINTGFNGLVDDIAGVDRSIDAVKTSVDGVGDAVDNVDASVQDVGTSVDAVNDSVQDVGTSVDDLATTVEEGNQADQDRFDEFMSEDGAPTADDVTAAFDGQSVSDDLMADFETENEGIQGDLTQRYEDLFESDSSIVGRALSGVRDTATSWLPSIPSGGGCVPLTFSFQGHTMVIECRVFDLIKAALSWLLFFFTAYQITMMALSYRSGQEA